MRRIVELTIDGTIDYWPIEVSHREVEFVSQTVQRSKIVQVLSNKGRFAEWHQNHLEVRS